LCAASSVSATSSSRPPLLSSPAYGAGSVGSTAARCVVAPFSPPCHGSRPSSHGHFARARGFWSGALMAAKATPPRLASGGGASPSAALLQNSEKPHSSRVAIVPGWAEPLALSSREKEGWSRVRGRRLPGTSRGCAPHAVASRQVAHLTLPRAGRAGRTAALTTPHACRGRPEDCPTIISSISCAILRSQKESSGLRIRPRASWWCVSPCSCSRCCRR
jgi:hypothetical protein